LQRNSDRHLDKIKQPQCFGRGNSEGQEFTIGGTSIPCDLEILDHLESNHGSHILHRLTRDNNNIRKGRRMRIPRPLNSTANSLNTPASKPSHIYQQENETIGAGQPLGFGGQVHLQQLVWHSGRCGRWWII